MAASAPLTRRALLFGRSAAEAPAPRPPWALPGSGFASRCTRCDACVRACPEHVLRRDAAGLPHFDAMLGECTFCGDCVRACESGALDAAVSPPWELHALVGEDCLAAHGVVCSSCREVCPESAIRVPPGALGMARVDPERCTGCGACVGICPAAAIALAHTPLEAPA